MVLMNKVFQHIHSFQMFLLETFIKINLEPGNSRIDTTIILGNKLRYFIYAIYTSNAALHTILQIVLDTTLS